MIKLIRDKIAAEIVVTDPNKIYKEQDINKYLKFLCLKVSEEAQELFDEVKTGNIDNMIEEFGDIYQVVNDLYEAIIQRTGKNVDDIVSVRQKKYNEKGGFSGAYILNEV